MGNYRVRGSHCRCMSTILLRARLGHSSIRSVQLINGVSSFKMLLNGANITSIRGIQSSRMLSTGSEESIVSKAVKSISEKKPITPESIDASTTAAPVKLSLMTRAKEGLMHYWHGSKLLYFETKISSKLLWKMLMGERLIRREHRQLRRTVSDLTRLVPFVVILIVPFLEFALPLILKLFPNMLPSTFEDKSTFVPL